MASFNIATSFCLHFSIIDRTCFSLHAPHQPHCSIEFTKRLTTIAIIMNITAEEPVYVCVCPDELRFVCRAIKGEPYSLKTSWKQHEFNYTFAWVEEEKEERKRERKPGDIPNRAVSHLILISLIVPFLNRFRLLWFSSILFITS